MHTSSLKSIALMVFIGLTALACDIGAFANSAANKPNVVIQAPTSGSQFREGDEIVVQSIAADPTGIVRVVLSVDDNAVSTDLPPIAAGQASFTLVQKWKATSGAHTISVRAFNAAGLASDPVVVNITVAATNVPAASTATLVVQQPSPGVASPTGSSGAVTATLPPSGTGIAPSLTRTPTPRPTTRVPAPATTTINAPPDVYATNIRIDPPTAKSNQAPAFFVTFFNNTGEAKHFRWRVKIFRPDERNSFGDSALLEMDIPVGLNEIAAPSNWKTISLDCQPYVARVFWVDADNVNNVHEFVKPDRSGGPSIGFSVCP